MQNIVETEKFRNKLKPAALPPPVLFLILVGALAVRLHALNAMPINVDEYAVSIGAARYITEGKSVNFFGLPVSVFGGHATIPVLYSFFTFISSIFFVDPVLIARIPAVLLGTITVFTTYLFTKEIYSQKVGLLSALFLAFFPWHVVMSRIGLFNILVPLTGTLCFYMLFAGFKRRNTRFLLLSFPVLGIGALYSYPNARIFIPLFLFILVFCMNKERWPKPVVIVTGLFLFLISAWPAFYANTKVDFFTAPNYTSALNANSFKAVHAYSVVLRTAFANINSFLQSSFTFNSGTMPLYAPSMQAPLFVSPHFMPFFLLAVIYAFYRHREGDVLLLGWLFLSIAAPAIMITSNFSTRHCFAMLPVPLIFMARFSIELFENKRWFKSKFVEIFIALFVTLFVFSSLKVLMRYFREAPENYWENLNSSAGSKETARYLYEQTDSSAGYVLADYRMLVEVYLQSFVKITEREMESSLWRRPHVYEFHGWVPGYSMNTEELQSLENKILKEGKALYYTLWSPVTHQRRNPWEARFSRFYETFRQVHPQKNAEKIIYYPDGTPAVEIFKILPKIVEE